MAPPKKTTPEKMTQISLAAFFAAPKTAIPPPAEMSDEDVADSQPPVAPSRKRAIIDDSDDDSSSTSLKENSAAAKDAATKKIKRESPAKPAAESPSDVQADSDDAKTTAPSWKKGQDIPYAALCETFEKIETTTKRLIILDYLTSFFTQAITLSPHCLRECIYLCINKMGPEYEGVELGIGESILTKAVAEATGRTASQMKSEVEQVGDLGTVAQSSRSKQPLMFKPKPLTVVSVFKTLKEIASMTGNGSQQKKIDKIKRMLVACDGSQPKFLIRSLEGKLRISLAGQTVVVAIAHASVHTHPSTRSLPRAEREARLPAAAETMKSVFSEIPSYDLIVPALLEHGINELPKFCHLTPGIPLKPMLAHPTKALTEILTRFENMNFTCEYKYDGERAQIHRLDSGESMIFSRNLENLSGKYPDIQARIPSFTRGAETTSYVLDCEAVAWDREKKCILPFQVLSTRKRKDVTTENVTIQVCVFAFDLLYLNGKSLVHETLERRRELLRKHFVETEGIFGLARSMESDNVEEIETFLNKSVEDNCEGLMVKTLDKEASYEPSKRSRNWLKVKKDYISDGIGDSLDLVVIGAYTGRGKRTGVYGGYLLACYDEQAEEYQSICKIGTGFSEQDLAEHAAYFKDKIIAKPKFYYKYSDSPNVRPDVWFEPAQVWEVKCADLSISPVHQAGVGRVDPNKGISLRFPRFIRIRDDKKPEDATSSGQVAEMYNSQKIITNNNKLANAPAADDDFEY